MTDPRGRAGVPRRRQIGREYVKKIFQVPCSIPDTVLALQTLAFRYDWADFYEAILADSALFVDALRCYRRGQGDDHFSFEDMAPGLADLPPSLASYLRSDSAEALTRHPALDTYLSSLLSYRA